MNENIDNIDLEILDAAFYDEPWHILCNMVSNYFDDICELIPIIFKLKNQGLLEIKRDPGTMVDPSEEDLKTIALRSASYGQNGWPEGPTWSIKTTEKGFEHIKDRFERKYL